LSSTNKSELNTDILAQQRQCRDSDDKGLGFNGANLNFSLYYQLPEQDAEN